MKQNKQNTDDQSLIARTHMTLLREQKMESCFLPSACALWYTSQLNRHNNNKVCQLRKRKCYVALFYLVAFSFRDYYTY